MAEQTLLERLDGIEARFEEVSTLITDPAVIADMKRYVRLSKEYKDLERLTALTRRYRELTDNIVEARELLASEMTPKYARWPVNSLKPRQRLFRGLRRR